MKCDMTIYDKKALDFVKTYFSELILIDIVYSSDIQKKLAQNKSFVVNGISISKSRTTIVAEKANYTCIQCKNISKYAAILYSPHQNNYTCSFLIEIDGELIPLTKDHIIPKSKNGKDNYKNLQCMCYSCNQIKSNSITSKYTKSKETMVTIKKSEYDTLKRKQTDFYDTRKNIKRAIKHCPWYLKVLGAHRYIENRIKKYLVDKNYYK